MKSSLTPIFLLFLSVTPSASAQNCCELPRLITVTGTAEINIPPDGVVLSLGVESRDKDLATAKSQHDSRVKKVIADARNAGVEPKNIQTNALSMSADYSEEKVPRFLAYEVTQTVEVTLKDLSKYETLVTKVLEDGVNRIHSVEFLVADTRKYRDEARQKAIRAAREKATRWPPNWGKVSANPGQSPRTAPTQNIIWRMRTPHLAMAEAKLRKSPVSHQAKSVFAPLSMSALS